MKTKLWSKHCFPLENEGLRYKLHCAFSKTTRMRQKTTAKGKYLTWRDSIYASDFKVSLVYLLGNNERICDFKAPKFRMNILVLWWHLFINSLILFFFNVPSKSIHTARHEQVTQPILFNSQSNALNGIVNSSCYAFIGTSCDFIPLSPLKGIIIFLPLKCRQNGLVTHIHLCKHTHTHTHWPYPSCGGNEDNNGNAEGQRQHQSRQHGGSLFHTLQESPVELLVAAAHPLSDRPPGDGALLVLLLNNVLVPPRVHTVCGMLDLVGEASGWRGAQFLSIHAPVCCRVRPVRIAVVLFLFVFRSVWLREIQWGHIVGLFKGAPVKLGQPLVAEVWAEPAPRVTIVAATAAEVGVVAGVCWWWGAVFSSGPVRAGWAG